MQLTIMHTSITNNTTNHKNRQTTHGDACDSKRYAEEYKRLKQRNGIVEAEALHPPHRVY